MSHHRIIHFKLTRCYLSIIVSIELEEKALILKDPVPGILLPLHLRPTKTHSRLVLAKPPSFLFPRCSKNLGVKPSSI